MSLFVEDALENEFIRLAKDYQAAIEDNAEVNRKASRDFDTVLPRLTGEARQEYEKEIERKLTASMCHLIDCKEKILRFALKYLRSLPPAGAAHPVGEHEQAPCGGQPAETG